MGPLAGLRRDFTAQLRSEEAELMDAWLTRRRAACGSVPRNLRGEAAWLDHLPQVLREVIAALSPVEAESDGAAAAHAQHRHVQQFSAEGAVTDLHLLGQILRERLVGFLLSRPRVDMAQAMMLSQALEEVLERRVQQAVDAFFQERREEQRFREQVLRRKLAGVSEDYSGTCEAVTGYSHDLKGCTDLLMQLTTVIRERIGGDADGLLSALADGLQYNHKILSDLAAISQEASEERLEEICIPVLLRQVWNRLAFPGGRAASMTLRWEAETPVFVQADLLSLERIVSNLLENVLRHGVRDQAVGMGWWRDAERQVRVEIENQVPEGSLRGEVADGAWQTEAPFVRPGTGISVVGSLLRQLDGELAYCRVGKDRVRVRVCWPG